MTFVDPLGRMGAYQLASSLRGDSWGDVELLNDNPLTVEVAAQLYRAIGSITANLAEGYSRSSGADRSRLFEYALGSAREAAEWYRAGLPVLDETLVDKRIEVLEEIFRLLLATIPRERTRTIRLNRKSAT